MENNKKSIYTVVGIIVLVIIVLIIKAVTGGEDAQVESPMVVATSTAASTTESAQPVAGAKTSTSKSGTTPKAPSPALTDAEINAAIRSSFVRVPTSGVDVKLVDGSASYTEGATEGKIQVGPIYAKVPTTDGYDVFVSMTLTDLEKEAALNYVAVFHLAGKTVRYTSSILIGDRLPVVNVVASSLPTAPLNRMLPYMDSQYGYRLTINYLGRKNLESVEVTPSVAKDMIVSVKNHIIAR
jgi:hypothetical protein